MTDTDFQGISAEGLMLLAENRFQNSKLFYDENKERLKALTTQPARQLASLLTQTLEQTDAQIETDPVKMVSRIRRDTRFSRDKSLYRENMWIMFMRNKHQWTNQPCMWFEFYPTRYTYGVGMFRTESGYMDFFRKKLQKEPERFRQALQSARSVGAVPCVEGRYKRDKVTGFADDLTDYANCKSVYLIHTADDMTLLEDTRIVCALRRAIEAYTPMYRFLLEVMEDIIQTGNG